jgi:hypothetical protein
MARIIQKWSARLMPLQKAAFLEALRELNVLYRQYGRVEWARVHHELYGGHTVHMEREFPDIAALDADETRSMTPEIREAKRRLLACIVPGTVEVTHYQMAEG